MNHNFNVGIAARYGLLEAILFENISYWVAKNRANNVHYHDGHYWTYNSARAYSEMMPYASQRSIARALKHLAEEELIVIGNYNSSPYDRTAWYAVTRKGMTVRQNDIFGMDGLAEEYPAQEEKPGREAERHPEQQNGNAGLSAGTQEEDRNGRIPEIDKNGSMDFPDGQIDLPDWQMKMTPVSNENVENGRPIPIINTDIDTDINTNKNVVTVSDDTVRQTDVRRAAEEWNKLSASGVKPITKLMGNSKRCSSLKARIREYGIDDVLKAINNIRDSSFLLGKGKRGWTITFDWFVRPNNFPKVLDGQYADKGDSSGDGWEAWLNDEE